MDTGDTSSSIVGSKPSSYQLIGSSDQRNQVNYDPSGSNLSVTSSIDSGEFVVDTGIPIKSTASNSNQSKFDRKSQLYHKLISDDGSDSAKGSILSTGNQFITLFITNNQHYLIL